MAQLLPILQTSAALVCDESLERIARLFAEKAGPDPPAWPHVASEAGLSASQVDEFKLALEFAALTNRDLGLINELQARPRPDRFARRRVGVEVKNLGFLAARWRIYGQHSAF